MHLRIQKFLAPALVLGVLLSPAAATPAATDAAAPATRAAATLPSVTPHGILADRVVPLAHLEDLDGSAAAPAATAARWRQALHELGRAAEDPAAWPAAAAAKAAASPRATPPTHLLRSWYAHHRHRGSGPSCNRGQLGHAGGGLVCGGLGRACVRG